MSRQSMQLFNLIMMDWILFSELQVRAWLSNKVEVWWKKNKEDIYLKVGNYFWQ